VVNGAANLCEHRLKLCARIEVRDERLDEAAMKLYILVRHRLLRQPHGFEGFVLLAVLAAFGYLAAAYG
jgi:hypothetical protein